MLVIFETAFEEWGERRWPSADQQLRVLGFLADVADGTPRSTSWCIAAFGGVPGAARHR